MTAAAWKLIPYIAGNGKVPVEQFLEELETTDPDCYVYFTDVLRPLVEEFGPGLGDPHFKRLPPSEFSELRWRASDNGHARIYCSIEPGRKLVLYHGVVKRWKKFAPEDKQVCRNRFRDYHSPEYKPNERLQRRTGTDA